MSFKNIIGHNDVIKNLLPRIKQNRLPHAMMFYGPSGIGKRTLAAEIIKAINCKNSEDDPCDTCNSCKWINENQHPDVIMITNGIRAESLGIQLLFRKGSATGDSQDETVVSDGTGRKDILIEQIRYLNDVIYTAPIEGRFRIVFIIDAETLNKSSANAFLKTLEEPPDRTIIIMTSSYLGMVPQTIRSRVEKIRLNPLKNEDMKRLLKEKIGISSEYLMLTLRLLNGSLNRRLLSLDDDSIREYLKIAKQFIYQNKVRFEDLFKTAQLISSGANREERETRAYIFFTFIRDMMLDIYLGRNEDIWGINPYKTIEISFDMIEDLEDIITFLRRSQSLYCNTGITVKSELLRYTRLWNILSV